MSSKHWPSHESTITIARTKQEVIGFTELEAAHIAHQYLDKIKRDRWTDEGKLKEEHYTSHRFDADCDDQSDYELVATIEKLQAMIKARL